jgi:hypothetical protein
MEFTSAEYQPYQINVWMFGEKNHSPNITGAAAMRVDNRYLPSWFIKEDNLCGLRGGRWKGFFLCGLWGGRWESFCLYFAGG